MASIANLQQLVTMRGTKTNIEALSASLEEVVFAYATDTSEIGIYTNGGWVWIGNSPPPGQYRQFLYELDGLGDFIFLTDSDGNPLMALMDLE